MGTGYAGRRQRSHRQVIVRAAARQRFLGSGSERLKQALRRFEPAEEADAAPVQDAKPVDKTVPIKREDSQPAEEAGAAPVQDAKPDEKKAPAQKAAGDSEGDEKPEGRLLPWEPATPAEGSEATDK